MSLRQGLLGFKEQFKQNTPIEIQRVMEQATRELAESDAAKGLRVGEQAPDFTLPDPAGLQVSLYDKLHTGPVILSFYRGTWCPYCNLELKAYQSIIQEIHDTGAELMAISPQTPDASLTTMEKNGLSFIVLSDVSGHVAQEYKLLFKLPDYRIQVYKQLGVDIPSHNGSDAWELPVPATFVIDQSAIIRLASVDPDYRNRAEPSEVLDLVKTLAQ